MHHTVRAAVAAAAVAAVGFGVSAPVASAAPKDRPAHVKVVKAKSDKAKHGRAVRTAVFVRNTLRQAAGLQARVDANAPLVVDNADASAANQVAADAVAAAVEKAGLITVDSTKADRKAVRADLHTARVALGAVEDLLAAASEQPVTEEPVTEPVVTDPVTEPVTDPAL